MATENRKSTTGKNTRKKSSSRGKSSTSRGKNSSTRKEQTSGISLEKEGMLWAIIAISILLFISNFGLGGKIGNAVSSFFFGVFGLIAYVFPLVLLFGTFFAVSNRGNKIALLKIISSILFATFLCMFIELALYGGEVKTIPEAFRYSFENRTGGGLIGGFLVSIFCPNFGLIGSYVINIIVLIVLLVLITEKSAFLGMKKGGEKMYQSAKVSNERHKEAQAQRREERSKRRMDRKVSGVSIDTRILPEQEESDEISEIHFDEALEIPEIKEEKRTTLRPANIKFEGVGFDEPVSTETVPNETISSETISNEPLFEEAPQEKVKQQKNISFKETEPVIREHKKAKQTKEEINENVSEITAEMNSMQSERQYVFPPISLLKKGENKVSSDSKRHLQETANKLQTTLKNFGVNVTITNVSCGPAVTRYELQPEMGVKVSKIVNLADDIKLNLAASDIRIEAPIPGKAAVGIEVPNKENVAVMFRDLVESEEFQKHESKIAFCVGKDIAGKVTVSDIAKMPHLLIAGATGSGKSVCINTIIMSILYKADPKDVKLIMIDPKVVELSVYNGIPHLLIPVVTDPKKAAGALHWALAEMTERYNKFAEAGVRDLKGYNAKVDSLASIEGEEKPERLPQIIIIVDELADLMMVAPGDVEDAICRLAQLARACGIHLIIATQRPSVNVITGLIKANMPSRIAFAVTSGVDSRTILDMNGAEKLLGKGDMLFNPQGVPKPLRVQGSFVSDKEVSDVVAFLKENNGHAAYNQKIEEKIKSNESNTSCNIGGDASDQDAKDAYFEDAARLLIEKEKGSIGMLQRYFKIGFNRAARIMDQLEEAGIVGPEEGTKPRKVLMSPEEFETYVEESL